MIRLKVLILFISLFIVNFSFATHNRGGEITYIHLSGLTYEFTITTCTDIGSSTDRDELYIDFNLGTSYAEQDTFQRANFTPLLFNHQKNIYIGIHTFTSAGTHRITIEDPNRNAGILNIYPTGGNSDDIVFALESFLIIDPFQGSAGGNNSVQFDNCPCPEIACVNKPYSYNPLAYDLDDDSLSYELVAPLGVFAVALSMPAVYVYPNSIGGGNFSIDPVFGTVTWNNPMIQGEFNYAIKISEWRNGNFVGSVIRDIQVTVQGNCNNDPPEITPLPDTCILAGDNISINILGTDINNDNLQMLASGIPFTLNSNPAVFSQVSSPGLINGTFAWQTTCSHIKPGNYAVMFSLTDDGIPVFSDYESMLIKVIPPIVTGLLAAPFGNGVNLSWDLATCSNADGYNIYRIIGANFTLPDCCSSFDLEDYGFTFVKQIIGVNNNSYFDNTSLTLGIDYCYVVTAIYNYGQVESCPSDTSCARLKKELPVITNVSVINTDVLSGADSVLWSIPTELDTLQYPGPYHYKIYYDSLANTNWSLVASTASSQFISLTDTVFYHTNINTVSSTNNYYIELYFTFNGADSLVGQTNLANSIYLSSIPNDNQISLSWNEQVPWINTSYEIFRSTSFSGTYISLGSINNQNYLDTGLVNGAEYCYYVQSDGYYTDSSIHSPLINKSQIICDTPIDLTAPCAPVVDIAGDCIKGENIISWTNPNNHCSDDVMSYSVYFTPIQDSSMTLIATISDVNDTTLIHYYTFNGTQSVAGCYAITAIDSIQYSNESVFSNTVCFDNCPSYWFPNVFSPNSDSENDYFMALEPFSYIESINLVIYNRWGQIVFSSLDPFFRWDGTNQESNMPVPSGVYYYVCTVNSIRLSGIEPVNLSGYLHLFRE